MEKIKYRFAELSDLEWINQKYDEVKFVHSDLKDEFIVIASDENAKLGIGRIALVDSHIWELGGMYTFPESRGRGVARAIVEKLLSKCSIGDQVFCLPFDHLTSFYSSFGFSEFNLSETIPPKIRKKWEWCNSGVFESKVKILVLWNQCNNF